MAYFIICYDISDDKTRNQIVKTLQDTGGKRVQYSVFELKIAKNKLTPLLKQLRTLLADKHDSIIVYELCRTCRSKASYSGHRKKPPDETVIVI